MAPRKRKPVKKIHPPKESKEVVIETAPFHITFPITLIHKEGKSTKYCYFQVKEHLDKYIKRLKLKSKDYKIEKTKPRTNEEA
jgi:hypothetical protein